MDSLGIEVTASFAQLKRQQVGGNRPKFTRKVINETNKRTDNCVKNHFYSKLRKSLRTVNKIAKLYLKK